MTVGIRALDPPDLLHRYCTRSAAALRGVQEEGKQLRYLGRDPNSASCWSRSCQMQGAMVTTRVRKSDPQLDNCTECESIGRWSCTVRQVILDCAIPPLTPQRRHTDFHVSVQILVSAGIHYLESTLNYPEVVPVELHKRSSHISAPLLGESMEV